MPRVFLSHSSKDKEFVRELHRRLSRDGVACFLDEESIGWGDEWVLTLQEGLETCESIVLVLSPDSCNSKWVTREWTSALADGKKILPLKLQDCTVPGFVRGLHTIDVSKDFDKHYPKICTRLGGTPGSDAAVPVDRTKLPHPQPLPAKHRMPHRSLQDKFIGRVEPFWQLRDILSQGGDVAVLHGTGGLGKTQLAVEFAYRFAAQYPGGVYWVDSERGLSVLVSQVAEAAGIEIDGRQPVEAQREQLWRRLNAVPEQALLILDNLPESVPLLPYLPVGGRFHTLITTRRTDLPHGTVQLKGLSPQEGVDLLNSGARKFAEADAKVLAERLGGLPLALEIARGYLSVRKSVTIPALLAEMSKSGDVALLSKLTEEYRDLLPTGHEKDILRTFQLSWDGASEAARKVLRVMGELAPVAVPRELLRAVLELPAVEGLSDPLGERIDELFRLSLVDLEENGDPVAHRLIVAFGRHRNGVDQASPLAACVQALGELMKRADLIEDAGTQWDLNRLAPHVELLLAGDWPYAMPTDYSRLANRLGTHCHALGNYAIATEWLRKALVSSEKSFPPGHTTIAARQSNLAAVLQDLGELSEARDLLRKALASSEKSLPLGHPEIGTYQSNLALVLKDLGELAEARELLRKALASDEKSFPPGHPTIARTQSNLAVVLLNLGELREARDLLRKVLASSEKSFSPNHPQFALSQLNLAMVLRHLGELPEARDLLRKALASDEETYPPGHPSIARSQSNLALVLHDLGELPEARNLIHKAYQSSLAWLGAEHPSTRTICNNLDAIEKAIQAKQQPTQTKY